MAVSAMTVVEYYDTMLADPNVGEYFGNRGWCNYGLWGEAATPAAAADALLEAVLVPVPSAPARVLDVGCGLGEAGAAMLERWPAADITGVNISTAQLKVASVRVPGVRFLQADAVELLTVPDRSIDLVVSLEAAFHFQPRVQFFQESARVLRSGGMLVMADALIGVMRGERRELWPAVNVVEGPEQYEGQLREVGFVDIRLRDVTAQVIPPMMAYRRRRLDRLRAEGVVAEAEHVRRSVRIASIPRVFRRYLLVAATMAAIR